MPREIYVTKVKIDVTTKIKIDVLFFSMLRTCERTISRDESQNHHVTSLNSPKSLSFVYGIVAILVSRFPIRYTKKRGTIKATRADIRGRYVYIIAVATARSDKSAT